jgi:hypothetical protein
MSKNRKNPSDGSRFAPALKALAICFMLGGSAIGYVGQKNNIYDLGDQIQKTERELDRLRAAGDEMARILSVLQTPREIEARVEQMNLGLVAPQPNQIVRIDEFAPEATLNPPPRLHAGQFAQINLAAGMGR